MSKIKTFFDCSGCGYKTPKWLGCCPECNEWNTFVQQEEHKFVAASKGAGNLQMVQLSQAVSFEKKRISSSFNEWDRVLGGGLIPGSFLILTGDSGIGKSTLLLQIAHDLAKSKKLFYFSSEESIAQVKHRFDRIVHEESQMLFSDEGNLDAIIATCETQKPEIVIIDSIQNCYFTQTQQIMSGTVGQLREAGFRLMRLAKENNITVIVTGHITKEGQIAGPKTLEHMVDAVFYLQGEDQLNIRVLRSVKNRFGSVNEIGFFEICSEGLREVPNINQQLLQNVSYAPGSVLISCFEGSRPLLLELQALIIPSKFGVPQRVITGVDHKRVILISAILEKYLQVKFSSHDIFFKVSGGFMVKESSADLGIALALLSSFFQLALPAKSISLGEISLTGQIKPTNNISMHISEAQKFGIEQIFISRGQKIEKGSYEVNHFSNVYELLKVFSEGNV